ncbi:hypothetical protein EOM57_01085 [Candidatus Saccharibacteria bacterium]|nr:hypothetical protein [Candidatus Saccharibacteria bacterium]
MPKYVKNGREIFASAKAHALFYAEQGYLPADEQADTPKDPEDNAPMDNKENGVSAEQNAPADTPKDPEDNAPMDNDDLPDDFEDEDEGVDLSPNGSTPLAARVALLTYNDLKAKAKELGIPKYSQTKQEELVILVTEAIENAA